MLHRTKGRSAGGEIVCLSQFIVARLFIGFSSIRDRVDVIRAESETTCVVGDGLIKAFIGLHPHGEKEH